MRTLACLPNLLPVKPPLIDLLSPILIPKDTLQGVPIGLTFGTLPFLLKPKLSYSQLALLSLSTYPYSLKLLWSPIVDSWFSAKLGRRKSWIVPVQAIMGCAMFWLGGRINGWLEQVRRQPHYPRILGAS